MLVILFYVLCATMVHVLWGLFLCISGTIGLCDVTCCRKCPKPYVVMLDALHVISVPYYYIIIIFSFRVITLG